MTSKTINNDKTVALNAEETILASRYRIVRQLGQGGMGSVWLAEDAQLDNKPFAIKMLPSILVANKRAYRQLKDEALVAMRLVHPNIVQIRAFEENDGNPFLVMDYVDGQTLDDYLAEHVHPLGEAASRRFTGTTGLPEADVLRILRPIAAALDYAHAKGVVHRDVKPGNVMIAKDGTPYILDFGIAREIQETMTRVTGKLSSGTLLYMSPEQLNGASPKPAQDIYSFAAMVYECLKGEPPFARGQIEYQILNNPPDLLPGGPRSCAAAVMAGLAKKPEDRPASCTAVLERKDLTQRRGEAESQSGGARRPAEPGGSRSRAAVKGILAAAALLVLAGGAWYYHHLQQEREEVRLAAERQAASDIRAEANVWQGKVSRIADSDGFTARKENLSDNLARAEALFDERTKRWSEAAQGFSNYVGQAEALVKLDGERQSAAATRARAEEAKSRAAEAESEKYALPCWTNAVWSLETGNGEFQEMRFVSASNAFVSAAAQFGRCVDAARTERTRLSAVAARDSQTARFERNTSMVEASPSATPEIARISVPIVITNTVEEVKGVVVVTNVVQQVTPPEVPRTTPPPVAANTTKEGEARPGAVIRQIVPTECVEECESLESRLASLESEMSAAGTFTWADEKDVSTWCKRRELMSSITVRAGKVTTNAIALMQKVRPIALANKGDSMVVALDKRVERLYESLTNVSARASQQGVIAEGMPLLMKCAAESVELEKELANLQSGLEAIGAVAWTDEKEVSAWEKLHASAVDVEAKANKARARASTLAESIKPVVRASKGDKTVSALDVRVERLNADLSVVAKQAAERLAITKGKVPLTKFANSCRALADGMTKIPAAYARKRERMAEIGNIEGLVRTSRTRNYSDLDELARKVAAIKTRSLDERKEEIALGQRVGKMIGDREQFMGARVLYGLRMQVPGESAQAQINAVLSAFKSQINVSSDAALPGRFANIESKAFQLADLVDEDASLQRLENTLRTVQRLAAMQR